MTVAARPARDLPPAANPQPAVSGFETPVRSGTYAFDSDDEVTGWHAHDFHQVEYAWQGVAQVETSTARYLLPPQQAIWIPAGTAHNTTLRRVRTVSVFLDPDLVPDTDDRARVLAAAPVIREMIVYATRWPITRSVSNPAADAYFTVLADLIAEWLEHETPLCLPTSSDPLISAVMDYTNTHLGQVTVSEICATVGLSQRTLRRRFRDETGITWRHYLLDCRLLRAMAILTDPAPSILDAATQVGFDSVSAFARAFRQYTGETPSAYRNRTRERRPD